MAYLTPADVEKMAKKMYGPAIWWSQLALNLGVNPTTVWRWQKRTKPMPYIVEVAVKGLWNEHQRLKKAAKEIRIRQRKLRLLKVGDNTVRKPRKYVRKLKSEDMTNG